MSDVLIRAEGLGKKYIIGHQAQRERYTALRDVLARGARTFLRKASDLVHGRAVIEGDELEEVWALQDVGFEVKRGEVLGIIGRNGAGKSTLLKILSRITEPSAGRVVLRGRVASLLEIGTGFHLELTGRENIYLNGAILGMSRAEIRKRFDEIVAFAEVERFLDTPVKRYSSGMYVRLAFAVAAYLEPEILIVDEVLAVGDVEFQRRCLGKMKDVSSSDGRTVLFVSHNMAAIETLCTSALLLEGGRIAKRGEVREVTHSYLEGSAELDPKGSFRVRQLAASLTLESLGFAPNPAVSGAEVDFHIQFSATERLKINELAILVYSALGVRVAIVDLRSSREVYRVEPGAGLRLEGRIDAVPFVEGDYSIGVFLDCGAVRGDFYELACLSIARASRESEIAPYAAHDRGFVELAHEVHVE